MPFGTVVVGSRERPRSLHLPQKPRANGALAPGSREIISSAFLARPAIPAPPGTGQVPVPRQVDPWYTVDPMYGVHHWAATTRPFPNAAMRPLPEGSTYAV